MFPSFLRGDKGDSWNYGPGRHISIKKRVKRMIKDDIKPLDEDNMMGTNQRSFYSLSEFFEIVNK